MEELFRKVQSVVREKSLSALFFVFLQEKSRRSNCKKPASNVPNENRFVVNNFCRRNLLNVHLLITDELRKDVRRKRKRGWLLAATPIYRSLAGLCVMGRRNGHDEGRKQAERTSRSVTVLKEEEHQNIRSGAEGKQLESSVNVFWRSEW